VLLLSRLLPQGVIVLCKGSLVIIVVVLSPEYRAIGFWLLVHGFKWPRVEQKADELLWLVCMCLCVFFPLA